MLVVNGISCRETEWNIDQFYCCCCISGHTASAAPASPTPGCCGAAFSLRGGDGVRFRDDLGLPSGSTISVSLGRVNRWSARRTLCGALGRKRLRPWPQVGLLLIRPTSEFAGDWVLCRRRSQNPVTSLKNSQAWDQILLMTNKKFLGFFLHENQ